MADIKFLNNIDLSQNQLLNARVHVNGSAPAGSGKGSIWLNSSTNELNFHNGTNFVSVMDNTTIADTIRSITVDTSGNGSADKTLETSETLMLKKGTNITLAEASGVVTISSTDTNTQNSYVSSFVDSGENALLRLTKSGAASGTQDLTFTAGSNITLTPDGTALSIVATNTQLSASQVRANFSGTGLISINGSGVISTTAQANVATNLSKTTTTTNVTVNSSTGSDIALGAATTSAAGVMTKAMFDKLDNIEANATEDQSAAQIRTAVGTGNSNFVPAAPSSATTKFLRGDGSFQVPSYVANTDTNVDVTTLETRLSQINSSITIGNANTVNTTISGDLIVNGDTTTVTSTIVAIGDNMMQMAKNNTANSKDIGWYGKIVAEGTKYPAMFYDASGGVGTPTFQVGLATVEPGSGATAIATKGTINANLTGNVSGNVSGNASGSAGTVTSIGNLTGDVTSSNRATTIGNDKVTYAKMQNVSATNKILGRDSSGAGNVEEISPANVKTMLALNNVANESRATILGGNLTGTINSVAVATVTSGAAAGATANQDSTSTIRTGTTAGNVGLGNVTNESKATMFSAAALTGNSTAVTQSAGNSSTRIATTAFVAAATASIGKVTKKISGTGSATSFTLSHNFGTPHVMVQLLDYGNNGTGATYDVVHANVRRSSDNAIDVIFGTAPTTSQDYLALITKMPAIS